MEEVINGDVNANNEHFRQVGFSKGVSRVEELLVEMIKVVDEDDLRPDGLPNAVDGERDIRAEAPAGDKGVGDKVGEGEPPKPVTEERLTEVLEALVTRREDEPAKPKEYTPEEIDQLLQVYKPSEKLIIDLRAEDPKVALAAIKELVGGVIKQANTMADLRIQQIVGDLREKELTPLQRYYQEAAAQREEATFYGKHDDLKPYELIVNAVSEKLEASGKKFDSKEKLFDEIARVSREAIKSMGITPKKGANGSAVRPSPQGGSRMSALSSGSGGRVAGGGTVEDKRRPGMAIFDETE